MATWVRNATAQKSATDADVTGTIELDNATAPSDFDPDAVNSVRFQMTCRIISGTFQSGGAEYHTVYHGVSLTLNGAGANVANVNGTDGVLDDGTNGGSTSSVDLTDSTIPTGYTAAQWEAMELNPTSGAPQWTDYVKNKGGDGVTVGYNTTDVTITIDYTPAVAAAYETREWRFRNHDNFTVGANSTSWGVAVDTVPTLDVGRGFRLRMAIAETAGGGATGESFNLQYRINTGTWQNVHANNPGDPNSRTDVYPVEMRRIQSTSLDGTATTQLLSSPDTFAAGELATVNWQASGSPDSSTTEHEWSLWLHRYTHDGSSLVELADGDTIEFRVQWLDNVTWTTISPATSLSNPSLTVNIPNYNIGGLYVENPSFRGGGPICDSNGNLYVIGEITEVDNTLMVHKSTDGGQTWSDLDTANRPTDTDIESLDTVVDGDEIYIFIHTGTVVKMFRFGLSDHVTVGNRDVWLDATGETVNSVTSPGDEQVSAALRSDGTVVCAYTDAATIEVNVRSTVPAWGTPTTVWNVTNMDSGIQGVLLPTSDDFVMFAIEDVNWDLHAKVWTSADALEDLDGVSVAATATGDLIDNNVEAKQTMSFGLHALSSSSLLVAGIDKTDDDGWMRKITGIGSTHSPGSRGNDINTTGQIPETIGLSEQPAASFSVHPTTGDVYAVYATEATAEATTNTLRYRVSTDDGATWGTENTIAEASPGRGWGDRVENITTAIYDRSGYKLGIFYSDASLEQQDDFTGTNARWGGFVTGWNWFHEIDVAAGTVYNDSLSVPITATTTTTDNLVGAEDLSVPITATTTTSDAHVGDENLTVPITATTTLADGIPYSDSLSVPVTATTTTSDTLVGAESLSVPITATTTMQDGLSYAADQLNVNITATTTTVDAAVRADSLSVPITATTTMVDGPAFQEDLSIPITATTTTTDSLVAADSLSVPITATTTSADVATFDENLTVPITATTTLVDGSTFDDNLSVAITATTTMADGIPYSDILSTSIVATTTTVDAAVFADSLTVPIAATTTSADGIPYSDSLTVPITATTTMTDTPLLLEQLSVDIVATTTAQDGLVYAADQLNVDIVATTATDDDLVAADDLTTSIVCTTTMVDELVSGNEYNESLSVAIVATTATTDALTGAETLSVPITCTTTTSDAYTTSESLSVPITATVTQTDAWVALDTLAVSIAATTTLTDAGVLADALTVPIVYTSTLQDAHINQSESLQILMDLFTVMVDNYIPAGAGGTSPFPYPLVPRHKGRPDHAIRAASRSRNVV